MSETKLKPFPTFASDEEAERFVDEADLSEYDFSDFKPVKTVEGPSFSRYAVRMRSEFFHRVTARARALGVSIDDYLIGLVEADLGEVHPGENEDEGGR